VILERSTHPEWLSNAYVIAARAGGSAIAIDSGAPLAPLFRAIEDHRLSLSAILCTHRHHDHVEGNRELASRTGASIFASSLEAAHVEGAEPFAANRELRFGDLVVRSIPLPGHTRGQCGYLVSGVGLFTGDCLFRGSLGGTVGPASSGFDDARRAVERILALPDETAIHPGHADPTTVGEERATNPFVLAMRKQQPAGAIGRCTALGRAADLIVMARDYDGGTKAWVRFDGDGSDAIVPGSRVEVRA
jgi:glyoxylase-like metal-dependent hydrolase (beta-lactamase superfamily II)